MPRARRYQDAIAGSDHPRFAIDLHFATAFEDEIDFLSRAMVMALRRATRGQAGLGEALICHRSIGTVENAPNGRAIGRGERRLAIE